MVFCEIVGVVNCVPEPKIVLSVEEAYQLMIPISVVAVKVAFPESHIGIVVFAMLKVGILLIVAFTATLVDSQPEASA